MVPETVLFRANSKAFIATLTDEQRAELIRAAKECRPSDCMECLFFKWLFDADKRPKESCALDYDEEISRPMHDKLCPVAFYR